VIMIPREYWVNTDKKRANASNDVSSAYCNIDQSNFNSTALLTFVIASSNSPASTAFLIKSNLGNTEAKLSSSMLFLPLANSITRAP
jgi:hypothetical protein